MKRWFRDWWRGWSDADARSAHAKICDNMKPGAVVFVTYRELRALTATIWIVPK